MSTSIDSSSKTITIDRGPGQAIMAGFCFVAADNPALGSTLREAAKHASQEFTAAIEATSRDSREGEYLRELLMTAVSFAAGLTRRQQERSQRIQAADQERDLNFKRIVQTQRLGGILRGGLQIFALGGFTYALVGAIFSRHWLDDQAAGAHREYVSLATALASALIGSFFKAWWTGYRIDQVDAKYKGALKEAKDIYLREATQEYEFAAQEANLAWQRFTGKTPPMTDAFRILILSLLTGEKEECRDVKGNGDDAD